MEYMEPKWQLAKTLRETMEKSSLTKEKLAEKSGIPSSYISQIENGKANPSVRTMRKLADAVGMKLVLKFVPISEKKPESCVACGMQTEYFISDPIQQRKNFVNGVGQLCSNCFRQIYGENQS